MARAQGPISSAVSEMEPAPGIVHCVRAAEAGVGRASRRAARSRATVELGEIVDDRETEPRSPDLLVGPHSPLQRVSGARQLPPGFASSNQVGQPAAWQDRATMMAAQTERPRGTRSLTLQTLLPIHVAAGGLVIVLGAVALAVKKGGTLHRRSGLLFVYWLWRVRGRTLPVVVL